MNFIRFATIKALPPNLCASAPSRLCVKYLFYAVLAVFLSPVYSPAQTEVSQLQLNQPIEREIQKDATQSFKVSVKAGDFVRFVAWQKSADVGLKAFSESGELLVETDNSDSRDEPERISLAVEKAGEI